MVALLGICVLIAAVRAPNLERLALILDRRLAPFVQRRETVVRLANNYCRHIGEESFSELM